MKITEQSLETLSKFDLTINEGTLTFNVKGDILVLKPIVDGGKVTYDMEYLDKKTNRKIQQYQEKRASLNADIDRILGQITDILGISFTEEE